MSRSLRTEPYSRRAARRVRGEVPVRVCAARPGFAHPASVADVRRLLALAGPVATYGVRAVELRQRPPGAGPIAVAALRVPGIVLLYEQAEPPWHLPGRLTDAATARLLRAGAVVTAGAAATRVDWTGGALRDFMLFDGLMHELGHHRVQHEARRRRTPAMRTSDHERRADDYAQRARLRAGRAEAEGAVG